MKPLIAAPLTLSEPSRPTGVAEQVPSEPRSLHGVVSRDVRWVTSGKAGQQMIWPLKRRAEKQAPVLYYLTFRLTTGTGKLLAYSDEELRRLRGELHLAGASDITVVDDEGRLVSFNPGSQ